MIILEPYIPREYLALKINYCKQQLAALPETVMTKRTIRGEKKDVFLLDSHYHQTNSKTGIKLASLTRQRELILCELSRLEGLWNSSFRGIPPAEIKPEKIIRRYIDSSNHSVIMDGKFFESLKNDANPYYPEHKKYYFNGIYYRSPAEADIARIYTEQQIPFKYEPEIWLKGLNHPIYTDFVFLIKELDLCKFHEHFGLKHSADYTRKTATTYINYSDAGLLPEIDVIYTYDVDGFPFDPRLLSVKLNSAVYGSLFGLNIPTSLNV